MADPAVEVSPPRTRLAPAVRRTAIKLSPTPDLAARVLETGLVAIVLLAPLPFGAVLEDGRLALEIAAFFLLGLWLVRSWFFDAKLPSKLALIGAFGLLAFATIQILPLNEVLIRGVSPTAHEFRQATHAPKDIANLEQRSLQVLPSSFAPAATLSVDHAATAGSLRAGAALLALFLVATSVVATCGPRRLIFALLLSASFQALYGILVLASDDPHIWSIPKRHYLESATGTFVNRNHFACFVYMAAIGGTALIAERFRMNAENGARRVLRFLRGQNARTVLLVLLLILTIAGLLSSLSRAGIVIGLAGLVFTFVRSFRRHLTQRAAVCILLLALAATPVAQLGAETLMLRFKSTSDDLLSVGGRSTVWSDSLDIIRAFPFAGSGFGTFAHVYPAYRSPEVRFFYAHAHNDLLQAVVEGGVIGTVFLMTLLFALGKRIIGGLACSFGTLGLGISAALAAYLAHGLVDFNSHIPANATIAVLLAGYLEGMTCHGSSE